MFHNYSRIRNQLQKALWGIHSPLEINILLNNQWGKRNQRKQMNKNKENISECVTRIKSLKNFTATNDYIKMIGNVFINLEKCLLGQACDGELHRSRNGSRRWTFVEAGLGQRPGPEQTWDRNRVQGSNHWVGGPEPETTEGPAMNLGSSRE